jgi:hypothetical protein
MVQNRRMKNFFVVLAAIVVAAMAFGAEGTPVKNWQNVQTYDLVALQKNIAPQQGKVVGIRCNFRGKDFHHMKPNWFESSIWQKKPDGKGFVDLRVMIAKKDLPAFKSITTEPGGPDMVLYGRVERDIEANFFYVRLLGRTANSDDKGNATIVW